MIGLCGRILWRKGRSCNTHLNAASVIQPSTGARLNGSACEKGGKKLLFFPPPNCLLALKACDSGSGANTAEQRCRCLAAASSFHLPPRSPAPLKHHSLMEGSVVTPGAAGSQGSPLWAEKTHYIGALKKRSLQLGRFRATR